MKRLTCWTCLASLASALPALGDDDAARADAKPAARQIVLEALAERATVPRETPPLSFEGGGARDRDGVPGGREQAQADAAKHGRAAEHDGSRMAHERALSHAAADGNATHVDAANRAAVHSAGGPRNQASVESHEAAAQIRTIHEPGECGEMAGGCRTPGRAPGEGAGFGVAKPAGVK